MAQVPGVVIIDVDIETGTSSVSVELETTQMAEAFKKLEGTYCLGERLSIRKIGEETTKTSAQAAVIALKALGMITGAQPRAQAKEGSDEEEAELALGPQTLDVKTSSLKTLQPSRIIKISGVFDREMTMTVE